MAPHLLDLDLEPMEARAVDALPTEPGWRFEPKWDGFRCIAYRRGGDVVLNAKSGKPLGRYFPDMLAALAAATAGDFVLDGELAIPAGDTLSFAALQDRLHPAASRVRKLAAAQPALLILFDCLATGADGSLLAAPLAQRRAALEAIFPQLGPRARLTPYTADRRTAQRWLDRTHGALDGVVAKRADGAYVPGERAMLKVKRLRTADCVVGGFRYAAGTREAGSILLGLYDEAGRLNDVGFSAAFKRAERPALTARLEALRGGPGFTGDAPGAPSRWSTERSAEWVPLRPELVAEVRYDHATGGKFRHGTSLVRWRPDKAPAQCTAEQLAEPAGPGALVSHILNARDEFNL
jgi:ATP-dependent DNA ligase